jgi:ethanolamine utilization protein EutN
MVTQGSAAAHMASDTPLPIDAIIIGIIDSVDIERGGENG